MLGSNILAGFIRQAVEKEHVTTKRDLRRGQRRANEPDPFCYIELNPVRAGMVADPDQYRWSSYHANGLGLADARLTPHAVYRAQGRDHEERTAAYRSLFRPQLDAEAAADIRQALQLGMPVGNDRFADAVCTRAGVRRNSGKRGRPPGETLREPAPVDGQGNLGF